MDAAAFKTLFERHEHALRAAVRRWVWDREDAAEIVQEAFARVWKIHDRLRSGTAAAYLYRTALNLAASKRRWKRVRASLRHRTIAPTVATAPEEIALEHERAAAVRTAVGELPPELRRVVELRDVTELSYAEIAKILQIKQGTVGSRRNAALARLRVALAVALAAGVVVSLALRPEPEPPPDPVDELLAGVDHPALLGWGRAPAELANELEPVPTRNAGVRMYRLRGP